MKISYPRSLIVSFAHLWAKTHGISFGEAQRLSWAAWKCNKLTELLQDFIIDFDYLKKDGVTLRKATGTLSKEFVSYEKLTERKASDKVFVYFDLEAGELRSFLRANLKRIKAVKTINILVTI
jgi:hypothetical protein